jgi:CTP-dependent riboflavin kinase
MVFCFFVDIQITNRQNVNIQITDSKNLDIDNPNTCGRLFGGVYTVNCRVKNVNIFLILLTI